MTRPLLYDEIDQDSMNASFHARGWPPVYTASPRSRIVLVGQAPGRIAQETRTPWNDAALHVGGARGLDDRGGDL